MSDSKNAAASVVTDGRGKPKLSGEAKKNILMYGLLRLVMFLVLTFVIHSVVFLLGMANFFPLLMSALLALILALPLSMFVFSSMRRKATEGVAEWDAARQQHKRELRQQLQERLNN